MPNIDWNKKTQIKILNSNGNSAINIVESPTTTINPSELGSALHMTNYATLVREFRYSQNPDDFPNKILMQSYSGSEVYHDFTDGVFTLICEDNYIGFNSNQSGIFGGLSSMTSCDCSHISTDSAYDISNCFAQCTNLINLNFFVNTGNVTTVPGLFQFCSSLVTLDLSKVDLSKVSLTTGCFQSCTSLKTIYANENTFKAAREAYTNPDGTFYNCTSLVGGNGTIYDSANFSANYARIDKDGEPGYFTFGNGEISIEDNIVSGTLLLDEIIASGNVIFGLSCANRFEVQLYNISSDELVNYKIKVTQTDENDVENNLFVGIIDSANKNDNDVVWKIIAYDEFYSKRNTNIADWWNLFWQDTETSTLKILRQSLLTFVGLSEVENVSLINENKIVRKNITISSMSFADMFSMICELSAIFPNVNRDGYVEYIELGAIPNSISGLYEIGNSTIENIESQSITGIQVYDSSNNLKYTYGNDGNTYMYSGNIFMMDMNTVELESFCRDIYTKIKYISYRNASVKMITSNIDYKVGDLISTEKGNFYIFENILSGSQLVEQTFLANASMTFGDAPSVTRDFVIINERIAIVRDTVDEFLRSYYDPETGNYAQLQITANGIKSTVGEASKKYPGTIEGIEPYIKPDENVNKVLLPHDIVGVVNYDTDKFIALSEYGWIYYCDGAYDDWQAYEITNLPNTVKFAGIACHDGRVVICGNYYINNIYYNHCYFYSDDYTDKDSWTAYTIGESSSIPVKSITYTTYIGDASEYSGFQAINRDGRVYFNYSGTNEWKFAVYLTLYSNNLKFAGNYVYALGSGKALLAPYGDTPATPIGNVRNYATIFSSTNYDYTDIAYGKTKYVMVAHRKDSGHENEGGIFVSDDGYNFTKLDYDFIIYAIEYNSKIGFIGTGQSGKTYLSEDGETWKESLTVGATDISIGIAIQKGFTSKGDENYVTVLYTDGNTVYRERVLYNDGTAGYTVELYGYGNPTGNSFYEKDKNIEKNYLDNETGDVYTLSKNTSTGDYVWTKIDTQTALMDDVYSQIDQTNTNIVLKVNSHGKIVEAGLSVDPDDDNTTEFHVTADNINMTAEEAINFLSNGDLNLTGKNIIITSDNFNVNAEGEIEASALTITGGIIDVSTNENDKELLILNGFAGLENITINFSGLPQTKPDYAGIGSPDSELGENNKFYYDLESKLLYLKSNNTWSEVPQAFYNTDDSDKVYSIKVFISSDGGLEISGSNYVERSWEDNYQKNTNKIQVLPNQILFSGSDSMTKSGETVEITGAGGISFQFYVDDDPIPFEDGVIYFDHDVYFSNNVNVIGYFEGSFTGIANLTTLKIGNYELVTGFYTYASDGMDGDVELWISAPDITNALPAYVCASNLDTFGTFGCYNVGIDQTNEKIVFRTNAGYISGTAQMTYFYFKNV